MALNFRNVNASPSDPVATWPYEALVTAIEQGLVPDWRPIFDELKVDPWGPVSRKIQRYLEYAPRDGVTVLFRLAIDRARDNAEARERALVAARVRGAIEASGLTAGQFAERVGTSASRLSTYARGTVTPSAHMLIRILDTPELLER
ncbi:MAG: helix-turn-helix domain-containing protein [Actinomycetes bacterium]